MKQRVKRIINISMTVVLSASLALSAPCFGMPEENPKDFVPVIEEPEGSGPEILGAYSSDDVNYPVTGGNLRFRPSTGFITGADKSITEAVIPETINGVTVVGIDTWAIYECHSLKKIILPGTLRLS